MKIAGGSIVQSSYREENLQFIFIKYIYDQVLSNDSRWHIFYFTSADIIRERFEVLQKEIIARKG
jgi:hypothetical protein